MEKKQRNWAKRVVRLPITGKDPKRNQFIDSGWKPNVDYKWSKELPLEKSMANDIILMYLIGRLAFVFLQNKKEEKINGELPSQTEHWGGLGETEREPERQKLSAFAFNRNG